MPKRTRSHSAFLREIRASQGLNAKQADKAYSTLKGRLGRAPLKADISRHPRMTRDAVKVAAAPPPKAKPAAKGGKGKAPAKKADRTTPAGRGGGKGSSTGRQAGAEPQGTITIESLAHWLQLRPDLWDEAEWLDEEYHAGGEYEYTPHG